MKKALAMLLVVALMMSLLPAQVFAQEESLVDLEILDTYVYDFMRGEDGIFHVFEVTIVNTFSDGSIQEEWRRLWANDGTQVNWGAIWLQDNQHEALWETGNTYQVTYGDGKTFDVEVRENPISRIEIQDATWCFPADDQGKFDYPLNYTVYFKDGTSREYSGGFYDEGVGMVEWVLEDGQETEPWVLGGTYEVTGSILDVSDTFNVTVVAVQDIEVEDIEVWKNTNGYWAGYWDENGNYTENAWWCYYVQPERYTVHYTDGSSITGTWYELRDQYDLEIWCMDDQSYESPWGVGQHTATVSLQGFDKPYTVTVLDTAIESIVIEDVYCREGEYYVDHGTWFEYSVYPSQMTITFRDGRVISGSYFDVGEQLGWDVNIQYSSDQTESNPWGSGAHTATLKLFDYETQYNVIVQEGPVQEIQVIKMPDKTEYLTGEYYDLTGAVIRVLYKDGSYEDIEIEDFGYEGYKRYFEKAGRYDSIDSGDSGHWIDTAGPQNLRFELLGKYFEIPIVAKENLMESISIKENPDKTLTITVNNSDNTSYDMKVRDVKNFWIGSTVVTDKGAFWGAINDYGDSFAVSLWNVTTGEWLESNSLYDRTWLETGRRIEDLSSLIAVCYEKEGRFSGKLTADNIDGIIELAIYESGLWVNDQHISSNGDYLVYRGEGVRTAVQEFFAVSNVDLTLSENYDAQTDTYQFLRQEMAPIRKYYPTQTSYRNGVLSARAVWRDASVMGGVDDIIVDMKLDDNYRIISFAVNASAQSGDIDGDQAVTQDDAVYLLLHTMFGEAFYPLNNAPADIDGSGTVDQDDAVYLLLHTMFGEMFYPLNTPALPAKTKE